MQLVKRFRNLGYTVGQLPTGPLNAIADVPSVKVGHTTLIEGDTIRTGVTVILPHDGNTFEEKVVAGVYTINGFGKATGFEQIRELGAIETPIALTNTLNVPRVADALMSYMLERNPLIGGRAGTVNPIVGECNDGFLNDIRGRHVTEAHVLQALATASNGTVAEGCVGGGTGTSCLGFKAGIGTASRKVNNYTLGVLVQSNFGRREDLTVLGVPVGRELLETDLPITPPGSIMVVLATDAPLVPFQLSNIAKRAAFGLGRVGSYASYGSGDFVIAFSTTNRLPHMGDSADMTFARLNDSPLLDTLYRASAEATEEAVLNSLIAATTMTGRNGNTMPALPHDKLLAILARYGRLPS